MRKWIWITGILAVVSSFALLLNHPVMAQANNIVVQTIPGPTVGQQLLTRASNSWPWYIVRGAGIVAAVSLFLLMLSGIGSVTGHMFKFMEPLTAWASHKALGTVFGISVLIHMIGLLFDHFVPFNILDILVPWLSNYKPVTIWGMQLGSLWVALGVLSFYAVALIVITSLVWIEKKPYMWKLIHLLSYAVMLFVFVHALYLGTDLAGGFLRWLWIALGIGIAYTVVIRLWRAKTT